MAQTVVWGPYEFKVYEKDDIFENQGGVYLFGGCNQFTDQWFVCYVGQTDSFAKDIPHNEKWLMAHQRGATHVLVLKERDKNTRLEIMNYIIQKANPMLNMS